MIYFLLILTIGNSVYIESYPNRAECEIRRQEVRIERPGINSMCLQMEKKNSV